MQLAENFKLEKKLIWDGRCKIVCSSRAREHQRIGEFNPSMEIRWCQVEPHIDDKNCW